MRSLQDLFDKMIVDFPWAWLDQQVDQKLAAQGIKLNRKDRQRLSEFIRGSGQGQIRFRQWPWQDTKDVTLHFTAEDTARYEKFEESLINKLPEMVEELSGKISVHMLEEMLRGWRAESKDVRRELDEVRRQIEEDYATPFGLFRLLLLLAREYAKSIAQEIGAARETKPHLTDALLRLQARAIRIAGEVLALLESGYSEGALARWRSLHEVATVAQLLTREPGSEGDERLAERYLLHTHVEEWRAAAEYRERSERLGLEPITDDEYAALEATFTELVKRFGKPYATPSGWAAERLGKKKPNFADIEAAVGFDHLRPHYRLASHNVHANPRGVFAHLGLLEIDGEPLDGPTNTGLAVPGRFAAASLSQALVALLKHSQNFDHIVFMKVISRLVDEIGLSFDKAEDALYVVAVVEDPSTTETT